MQDPITDNKNKKEFHLFVTSPFFDLTQFKKEGNRKAFNEQLLKIMPHVKRYIAKRWHTALTKNLIPKGKYKPDDFVDQLFIDAYEHFGQIANAKELHPWLFKKADELVNNTIIDEEFDSLFFENIDTYSKPEWEEMEENFSTDGDGDLVMLEELDDLRLNKNDYTLNHVFVEDTEKALAAKLDQTLNKDRVGNHINMVLSKLPMLRHTVFDLFNLERSEVAEIAKIKSISTEEVDQLLADTRKMLRSSFSKRYLMESN